MAHIEEPLDGGLVTSQDPTTLDPGELTAARNGFYAPKNKHIQRAPGWVSYSTAVTTATYVGMLGCYTPHNSTNYLLVQRDDGVLATGNAESASPTLAALYTSTVTGASALRSTVYNGKWYLFNGLENRVFCASGAGVQTRAHGMLPVDTKPTITVAGASAASVTATGWYTYWYTEVARYEDGADEVEGTYTGTKPSDPVLISSLATGAPTITFPPFKNPDTGNRNYRLYRSLAAASASGDAVYPDGIFVADVTASTFVDGGSAVAATGNFTIVDSFNHPAWATAAGTASTGGASGAMVVGGSEAFFNYKSSWGTALSGGQAWGGMFYTVNSAAAAVTGNVAGVQLDIKIKSNAPSKFKLTAYIGKRDATTTYLGATTHSLQALGAKVSLPNGAVGPALKSDGVVQLLSGLYPAKNIATAGLSSTYSTATIGGQYDDWLPSDYDWTATDFTDGKMALLLTIAPTGAGTAAPATNDYVAIDSIVMSVYQGGKDSITGNIYDVLTVEVGGSAVESGSHGKPPVASCGTIFEGSLVTDNVDKPGLIQYSMPGFPDYFPALYQIQLPPGTGSRKITYIGTVNNRLLVATNNATYRVNYLPNEDDASFSRGRAIETVSTLYGNLRPSTAAVVAAEAGLEELYFVSSIGVCATDGYSVKVASAELAWLDGIFYDELLPTETNCIALVVTPELQSLRLVLRVNSPADGVGVYYAASYAIQHRKDTGVKWSGPVQLVPGYTAVNSVATLSLINGSKRFICAYKASGSSVIYREAEPGWGQTYYNLPDNAQLAITTRYIALAGRGNEGRVDGIYVLGRAYRSSGADTYSPAVSMVCRQLNANRPQTSTEVAATTSTGPTCREAYVPVGDVNTSMLALDITQTDAYMLDLVSVTLVGDSFGDEEAG